MGATATDRRIAERNGETLRRLADQGERNGVRILVDHRREQHVATSATDPTACYFVGVEEGCTCRGYAKWGRCQHHSLLLSELGVIPDPNPAPDLTVLLWGDGDGLAREVESGEATGVRCAGCGDRGWVYGEAGGGGWPLEAPCRACRGETAAAPAAA
jgi:hypothetical protein